MATNTYASLTAEEASKMVLSIRLWSDGLTFALSPLEPTEAPPPMMRGLLELTSKGEGEGMKDLFFQHPFLLLPYARVRLYYEPKVGVVVPREFYDASKADIWLTHLGRVASSKNASGELHLLSYPIPHEPKMLLTLWERELYLFLARTHLVLDTAPYFAPSLEALMLSSRQSSGGRLVFYLCRERMDVCAVRMGALVYYNSFFFLQEHVATSCREELVYYVFALWRSLELREDTDSLLLCYATDSRGGERELVEGASQLLGAYLPHIEISEMIAP